MNTIQPGELRELITKQYGNITGIAVMKNDAVVFEEYFNGCNGNDCVHVASVTKSIVSALVGIAVDMGCIKDIGQPILDFFPDYAIKRGERLIRKITIQNVLTMTTPYKFKHEPYTKVYSSDDWTKAVLDLTGGKGEEGVFKYTSAGLQILSGILVNVTGQSLRDFAAEKLFALLEIKIPDNLSIRTRDDFVVFLKSNRDRVWVADPKGVNTAGWGLALSVNDLMKIGRLYLNGGIWKNRRILSSKWIENSTRVHSRYGELSYGFLWWIIDNDGAGSFAALGDGGNAVFVSPEKSIVVAITSLFLPRAKDRVELIKKHIIPMFD